MNKKPAALLMGCLAHFAFASSATATELEFKVAPSDVAVSGGIEIEAPGELTHTSILRKNGSRLLVSYQGVKIEWFAREDKKAAIAFLPLAVLFDPFAKIEANGVVKDPSASQAKAVFRKVVGTVIEAVTSQASGLIEYRAKLVSVDYDREKGFTDWQLAKAEVALVKSVSVGDVTTFDIEVSVGLASGFLEVKNLANLERVVGIDSGSDDAFTVTPSLLIRAGFSNPNWKILLTAQGAERFDVTDSSPVYLGHEVSANQSRSARLELSGEYRLWGSVAVFGNLVVDYDDLTVIRMLVGNGDFFVTGISTVGFKATF